MTRFNRLYYQIYAEPIIHECTSEKCQKLIARIIWELARKYELERFTHDCRQYKLYFQGDVEVKIDFALCFFQVSSPTNEISAEYAKEIISVLNSCGAE